MQDVNNFGSVLQAYGLKKMVESLGHEVVFFRIIPNKEDDRLIEQKEEYLEDHELSWNTTILKKIDRYLLVRIIQKICKERQNRIFSDFRHKYLSTSNDRERCNVCIIGSDEVFNCMLSSKWGFTSQLFGNIPNADSVITYAASCGSTRIEAVPEAVRNKIKDAFTSIRAFSVRDNNTNTFVASLTDKEIIESLDPVVISNYDKEIASVTLPSFFSTHKYCIVYSYPNRFHSPEDINNIVSFCKKRRLSLVTLGGYQTWINNSFALSPFQLLKAFRGADFIITDTFHGTIFSEKYAKRYAVLVRRSNSNKLEDLITRLSIECHQINDTKELDVAYKHTNDFIHIRELENMEYRNSLHYLQEHLRD